MSDDVVFIPSRKKSASSGRSDTTAPAGSPLFKPMADFVAPAQQQTLSGSSLPAAASRRLSRSAVSTRRPSLLQDPTSLTGSIRKVAIADADTLVGLAPKRALSSVGSPARSDATTSPRLAPDLASRCVLSPHEVAECEQAYDRVRATGDLCGTAFLVDLLADLGQSVSDQQLNDLLAEVGHRKSNQQQSGSGKIGARARAEAEDGAKAIAAKKPLPLEVFLAVMQKLKERYVTETARFSRPQQYDTLDAFVSLGGMPDGSGTVGIERLRNIMTAFNLRLDVDALVSSITDEGLGRDDEDEARSGVSEGKDATGFSPKERPLAPSSSTPPPSETQLTFAQFQRMFEKAQAMDGDSDIENGTGGMMTRLGERLRHLGLAVGSAGADATGQGAAATAATLARRGSVHVLNSDSLFLASVIGSAGETPRVAASSITSPKSVVSDVLLPSQRALTSVASSRFFAPHPPPPQQQQSFATAHIYDPFQSAPSSPENQNVVASPSSKGRQQGSGKKSKKQGGTWRGVQVAPPTDLHSPRVFRRSDRAPSDGRDARVVALEHEIAITGKEIHARRQRLMDNLDAVRSTNERLTRDTGKFLVKIQKLADRQRDIVWRQRFQTSRQALRALRQRQVAVLPDHFLDVYPKKTPNAGSACHTPSRLGSTLTTPRRGNSPVKGNSPAPFALSPGAISQVSSNVFSSPTTNTR